MSTARFNTLQNAAGSKSVPVDTVVDGSAKAWVNFNGTGTVAIRAAFNVQSITDLGVGSYRLNFSEALTDANYCAICDLATLNAGLGAQVASSGVGGTPTQQTTTALQVSVVSDSNNPADASNIYVTIFR